MQNGEVTQHNVVTVLEADAFVADTSRQHSVFRSTTQTTAPDESGAKNRKIMNVLSPDQAVVPMAVPEILVVVPLIGLWRIVTLPTGRRCIGGNDGCAGPEIQINIALQVERITQVRPSRENHGPAAICRGSIDSFVDRRSIQALAIASGTECPDIKFFARLLRLR